MTEKFINLKNNYVSIDSYRNPEAAACDLKGILESMECRDGDVLVCSIEDVVTKLQDGDYLSMCFVSRETVATLFDAINERA